MTADLLDRIERYYDTVPRATAEAREVGPFTLFVAHEGWPYYARPRLGESAPFRPQDVAGVLAAQREFDVPRQIEWVHENTPGLRPATLAAGVAVQECPLLVLEHPLQAEPPESVAVAMLQPGDERLPAAWAAVASGFDDRDEVSPEPVLAWLAARVRQRLLRVAGAFHPEATAIGGGSHALRDDVSELAGIAVLPSWRRRGVGAALTKALADDAITAGATTVFLSAGSPQVARVYERVGFRRVGTACIAKAS